MTIKKSFKRRYDPPTVTLADLRALVEELEDAGVPAGTTIAFSVGEDQRDGAWFYVTGEWE